jgi:hypothetical protein
MSDPRPPGEESEGASPADARPVPIRQRGQQATRVSWGISAWSKFSQFVLGVGIGSLPLPAAFLTGNLTIALVLYVALLMFSFVLMVRGTYAFVGFGMLAAVLADPVIAVQACFVSVGGPQGQLPPAASLHTHIAHMLVGSLRQG